MTLQIKYCQLQLLLSLLLLLSASCSQQKADITQWRGPDRDGFYPEKGLMSSWPEGGPELLWEYNDLGKGYTTVAVTEDKIFTSGTFDSTSYIIALDHDGNLLWKKEYGLAWMTNFPGARSTPLIVNDLGYVLSGRGKLVCFQTDNGFTVWTRDLYKDFVAREVRFGMTENLLVDGYKLFCTPGGLKNNIVALHRETGDVLWSSKANMEPSAYCSPRIIEHNGKKMYVTITAQSIVALDPEDGTFLWSHDLQYPHGIHGNTPIYHDGHIFAMNGWSFGSVMMKINGDNSGVEEVWRSHLFDLEHGDALRFGNNLYGTDYTTRQFACVDWYTGQVKDSMNQFAPGTLISAEGLIYCYSYLGDVALIRPEPDGFEVISSFETEGLKRDHIAHPVIDRGRLYIRYGNTLRVYDIRAKG